LATVENEKSFPAVGFSPTGPLLGLATEATERKEQSSHLGMVSER